MLHLPRGFPTWVRQGFMLILTCSQCKEYWTNVGADDGARWTFKAPPKLLQVILWETQKSEPNFMATS